ncbi:MAG: hypothetical protein KDK91_18525 [Gammaproteobacteria bacterium]|nr:hypothetical protein [Gammaproteobacteria bacterium]
MSVRPAPPCVLLKLSGACVLLPAALLAEVVSAPSGKLSAAPGDDAAVTRLDWNGASLPVVPLGDWLHESRSGETAEQPGPAPWYAVIVTLGEGGAYPHYAVPLLEAPVLLSRRTEPGLNTLIATAVVRKSEDPSRSLSHFSVELAGQWLHLPALERVEARLQGCVDSGALNCAP